ncbi:hypothetical protein K0T92_13745 [Paenibacillus oenotherae]|uniref:Uncharacterized protein n=1 Tax=Paenibacillus oenotherae TaxID=1435645 RepID=A0ABS7D7R1_9BACL|nr:hypothetical protein [Paenibacillus oenotherae]MBW7475813.1 hypothetical protein [Paenibacillus oenotherae]
MTKAFKLGRTLSVFVLALCLMTITAATAFADARTQIVYPSNGSLHNSAPTVVIWNQTTDVKASQLNITALDGSFVYNSGPIYKSPGSTSYVFYIPYSVYSTMPKGKAYSLYVEDYHYTGNTYTGYSSDQAFFSVLP